MRIPNSKDWKDLPEPLNCFTIRSAVLRNLNTGEIIRHYVANTKIVVTQKCVMSEKTYYRTSEAAHHCLNYAFEASAFGLPNEKAPSAHVSKYNSLDKQIHQVKPSSHTPPVKKQKSPKHINSPKKVTPPKDGEEGKPLKWVKKIFRRKNGKTKNS